MLTPMFGAMTDAVLMPAAFVVPVARNPFEATSGDLAAVRTVVEAAGGASQVHWAAGMVFTAGRKQIVATTDRGRSWMPAGAVLPADVVLPWTHPDSARWEGLRDPARVIVEYCAAVGGQLTALASTHSSAPGLLGDVPFVLADATDRAHPNLINGPVATRLDLQVEARFRQDAARLAENPLKQRGTALGMAYAHRAWLPPVAAQLLAVLQANQPKLENRSWMAARDWDAVVEECSVLQEQEHAARIDVWAVEVGALDTDGGRCRPLLLQLYAAETLLAQRHRTAVMALDDALYCWSMVRQLTRAPHGVPG